MIAHLAAGDTIAAPARGGRAAPPSSRSGAPSIPTGPFDIDAFNAWTVNRRSGLDTREVLDDSGVRPPSRSSSHCATISDEDWVSKRYDYGWPVDIAARYLVQTRVVEWWLHGEDMRATNGLGSERGSTGRSTSRSTSRCACCRGRSGAPAYDLSGLSVQGRRRRRRRGLVALGPRLRRGPVGRKKPDATIVGRAPQLALVAGQRLKPDDVLSSGNVVLGGDRLLADTVLRHLRAFP